MDCNEVLKILSDCYSLKDFHYTCDLLLENDSYPDTSKLDKLERIQFFRKKKELQKMFSEMDGVKFNPLYTLERLKMLERIAKLKGNKTNNNFNPVTSDIKPNNNNKTNFYIRLNQLI